MTPGACHLRNYNTRAESREVPTGLETLTSALDVPLADLAADAPIVAAVAEESLLCSQVGQREPMARLC